MTLLLLLPLLLLAVFSLFAAGARKRTS